MSMSDRELLELAAKASGYDVMRTVSGNLVVDFKKWNPLEDDGDALRLAVNLDISIRQSFAMVSADYPCIDADFNERKVICELVLDDYFSASRRVVVRAAAEIGKSMLERK